MDSYDSDDSVDELDNGTSTNVLLGYSSKAPTNDSFSQLGGYPNWLADTSPSASLAKCKVCNSYMSLLLQLNGDLPDQLPGHDRRLYIMACRRMPCKRKPGTVRAFRATRVSQRNVEEDLAARKAKKSEQPSKIDLGAALFGAKPSMNTAATNNPFILPRSTASSSPANPFSTAPAPPSSLAANPPQATRDSSQDEPALATTFAQKARISSPTPSTDSKVPNEPWPERSDFPSPYPSLFLDADYEYLYPTASPSAPSTLHTAMMDVDTPNSGSNSGKDGEQDAYESPHDTTFQAFADRLAQNPEQVLRYEFGGSPLLYSKTDAVGAALASYHTSANGSQASGAKVTTVRTTKASGIPNCAMCGAARVFELQLMPHAIAVLEDELDVAIALKEGMEWGNIVLGVCAKDCLPAGCQEGEVGYAEEWVGVQWEEVVQRSL